MKRFYIILLLALLMISCRKPAPVLVLLTDQMDAVTASEIFNAGSYGFKIRIDYEDNLERALLTGSEGDIILGKNINSPDVLSGFMSLDESVLETASEVFLLSEPYRNKALPLSFSSALVVFPSNIENPPGNKMLLDDEDIRSMIQGFNRTQAESWVQLGFSPLWSDQYLYQFMESYKPQFQAGAELLYSEDNVNMALSSLEEWIITENGSLDDARHFDEKYRYIPDLLLIHQNRILLTVQNLDSYLQAESHDTIGLEFRYLSFDGFVNCTNTVFGAVSDSTDYQEEAEFFLKWIQLPENQEQIIEFRQVSRLPGFGIFQGLSTQKEVREKVFPRIYPELVGFIPSEHYYRNEDVKDKRWESIKTQVLMPWITIALFGEAEQSLQDQYNEWLYYTIAE